MAEQESLTTTTNDDEEFEEITAEEQIDNPDGLIHKKKKKNKVGPAEPDTVTAEDERNMALKKLLETETELLYMKTLKNDREAEIVGLKMELKVLEKNFKELQEKSTQSLEEFQKFEIERMNGKIDDLEKEKETLKCQVSTAAAQEQATNKEMECLRNTIDRKDKEINEIKLKLDSLEDKHESALKELSSLTNEKETLLKEIKANAELCEEKEKKQKEEWLSQETKLISENENLKLEIEQLKTRQDVSDNEIKFLKTEISKVVAEKECEKKERLKTVERWKSVIEEKNKMEASFKLDMEQLANDFETVKKHLVGITNDKADIWNKFNDYFSHKQSERWVKDKETNNCTNCAETFTLTIRRHHCRICGHIFCYKCSNRWLLTPHSSKRIRACDVCADAYTEIHVNAERDEVDAADKYVELKGEDIKKYEVDPPEEEDD